MSDIKTLILANTFKMLHRVYVCMHLCGLFVVDIIL